MDTSQPTVQTTYVSAPAAPGMFGTRIPSSVAFVLGILLFLLPFSEIKCTGTTLTNKSGLDFALGNDWKPASSYGKEFLGKMTTKMTGKKEGKSQIFAIAALALGILGLIVSFVATKNGLSIGVVTGVLAAGALIGLMFEVKKWFKDLLAEQAAEKVKEGADTLGLDKVGDSMNAGIAFTSWFYIAIIAFLAAAFFCYKRMSASKTR